MMIDLPKELVDGEWPFADEIAMLKRMQKLQNDMDNKICHLQRELRASRFDARKTTTKEFQLRVYYSYTSPPPSSVEEEQEEQKTSTDEAPAADAAATTAPPATGEWTLRLETTAVKDEKSNTPSKPVAFSRYFRKISFELNAQLYPESLVEWTCFQRTSNEVDGVAITRPGSTPHTVKVKLLLGTSPERFTISDQLASAIGTYLGDAAAFPKQEIVMATWEYIKRRNLIKEDDCRVIQCDATLRQLFECDTLAFTSIVVALKPHLTPHSTVELEYALPLNANNAVMNELLDEQIFDVEVGAQDALDDTRRRVLADLDELQREQRKEMEMLKKQEDDLIIELHQACRKREWMLQFADDPCGFTMDVLKSQQADQQVLTAESEADGIGLPHPQQFHQPWVRQVVADLLAQQQQANPTGRK